MRILWVSNAPWAKTGYGVQSNLFLPRLNKLGHEIAILAYYGLEGGVLIWNGLMCYPKSLHPYGMDVIGTHARSFKANAIMTLMDTWVVKPELMHGVPWIPYYPVDHEPMPEKVRTAITQAYKRIAMSKFGEKQTHIAGLDCYYIPHGINTNLYKPIKKKEARAKLNVPQDAYIVGTVAMNKGVSPSRKSLEPMLRAFAEFKKRHPSAIYYMHTQRLGIDNQSVNLPELINFLGMIEGKDVLFPDQYGMLMGFPDDYMANMYSALDVHLLASMGEGFGVPIIEAQACGCPVIVGDWTSMSELCFAGKKIDKKDAEKFFTGIASYQYIARSDAILEALEEEYRHGSSKGRAAKEAAKFDADLITEKYWKPIMEEIETMMTTEQNNYVAGYERIKEGGFK